MIKILKNRRNDYDNPAEKLALDFKGRSEKFRILASDLKRAAESAAIIAARLHMDGKVEKHAFLREKNNGLAAGMTESEAKAIYRPAATLKELHHRNYPGGETRKEFYDRCVEGIKACADMEKARNFMTAALKALKPVLIWKKKT